VSEGEDFYFALAFNSAIRAVRFGGGDAVFAGTGGRREKGRDEESKKEGPRRKLELRRMK
jgi:hypothetical protein